MVVGGRAVMGGVVLSNDGESMPSLGWKLGCPHAQLLGPNPSAIQVHFLIKPREASSELLSGSTDLLLLALGTLAMQSSASCVPI